MGAPFEEDGRLEEDVEEPFEVVPFDVVPFEEDEEVPFEDAAIGSFIKEVETFEDVDERPVDGGVVCVPAVEDTGFDPDPVDGLFCVEDGLVTSLTGQTVV